MDLTELETPALVLDRTRLDHNIARMREHVTRLNVSALPFETIVPAMRVASAARSPRPQSKLPQA